MKKSLILTMFMIILVPAIKFLFDFKWEVATFYVAVFLWLWKATLLEKILGAAASEPKSGTV